MAIINSLNLEEKTGDRRRDDKPRTKIIRMVKKLADWILKKLVSVGDYKHKEKDRLLEAYTTAFDGFLNLLKYWNLELILNSVVCQSDNRNLDVGRFASICFPASKVSTIAHDLSCASEIKNMLKIRAGTSVKQLKEQVKVNIMTKFLFQLAFEMVKDFDECSNSVRLLEELRQL